MKGLVFLAMALPLAGTSLGAAGAFFIKHERMEALRRSLSALAAGVMAAASVWSLLIPALEAAAPLGRAAFAPATIGLWGGVLLLGALESRFPAPCGAARDELMILAIALHNVPEGMAVGVALAGCLAGTAPAGAALSLTLGIALQNVPEGAVVALPLRSAGMGRSRAFGAGVLSGAVEPAAALLALLAARLAAMAMPLLLGFAAGAMLYVVAMELLSAAPGEIGRYTSCFFLGFTLMMALDTAL